MPIGSDFNAGGMSDKSALEWIASRAFNLQRRYQAEGKEPPPEVQKEIDNLVAQGEVVMHRMQNEDGVSTPDLQAILNEACQPPGRPEIQIPMTAGQGPGVMPGNPGDFRGRPSGARVLMTTSGQKAYFLNAGDRLTDIIRPNTGGLTLGGFMKSMVSPSPEYRDMLVEGTDSSGGFSVPEILLPQWISSLTQAVVLNQAGMSTIILPAGNPVSMSRVDQLPKATWRHETVSIEKSDPVLGKVSFQPRTLVCRTSVSREMIQDSLNISGILEESLMQAMAQELNSALLTGSGTGGSIRGLKHEPGISDIDLGTDGSPLSDWTPYISAVEALTSKNAMEPSAFVQAPRTTAQGARLVDSTGQPLMKPDLIRDIPMLSTTAVPIDDVKGTSNDASQVFSGVWSSLVLGITMSLQIDVLREAHASEYAVGFLASMRCDSVILRPSEFCTISGIVPA